MPTKPNTQETISTEQLAHRRSVYEDYWYRDIDDHATDDDLRANRYMIVEYSDDVVVFLWLEPTAGAAADSVGASDTARTHVQVIDLDSGEDVGVWAKYFVGGPPPPLTPSVNASISTSRPAGPPPGGPAPPGGHAPG